MGSSSGLEASIHSNLVIIIIVAVIIIIIIIVIIIQQVLPLTSPPSPLLANTNHLITHCLPKAWL